MKEYFNRINNMNIFSAMIFVVIGTFLIFNPEGTTELVSYILGTLFVILGIIKIYNYMKDRKDENTYFRDDILYGVILILIGFFTLSLPLLLPTLFRLLFAVWIIYTGVLRLIYTFRFKVYGDNLWVLNFVLSLIILICGVCILITPGIIIKTIGIFVLVYAITDLIESFIFMDNIRKLGE